MWSKQADARNKNVTSLKGKITNRKRKTSKTRSTAVQSPTDSNVSVNAASSRENKTTKKQKNRKSRKDGCQAKQVEATLNSEPDLIDGLNKIPADKVKTNATISKDEVIKSANTDVELSVKSDGRLADVVLRNDGKANESFDSVNGVADFKRYSDSFVIGTDSTDGVRNVCQPKLSRAVSGFILTEAENSDYIIKEEKVGRKTRRFSDLFHYGALKTYNSCDNLKVNSKMMKHFDVVENGRLDDDIGEVVLKNVQQKSSSEAKKNTKGVKINESVDNKNLGNAENAVKGKVDVPLTNTNSSYLKRVKSKIYKNKTENSVGSSLPTMPDISETVKSKKNKNKKNAEIKSKVPVAVDGSEAIPDVKKSIPHFDFRLIRQTSNLERIRPRTFGPKKSSSNAGIPDLADNTVLTVKHDEKPILAKSKSSSAINLNMLRTRRNKIMEQVKNRNCKVVQNEFDFIAFTNRNSANGQAGRMFGGHNTEVKVNNSVVDHTPKQDVQLQQQTRGKYLYYKYLIIFK